MASSSSITFVKHKEIDRILWDKTITSSPDGLIYASSFYLDHMAGGWNALVGEGYEWVFPITQKSKYGITYLRQPIFCQQLGAFARPGVVIPFADIFDWLKKHFRFWEINLNYATESDLITPPVKMNTATNYILDLSNEYAHIAAKYHKDLVKNIRRSKHFSLVYTSTNDYKKGVELFEKAYGHRLGNITAEDYRSFSRICAYALENNMLIGREVINSRNELMSIILVLRDDRRLYNLMNVTTEAGRKVEANHFLLDLIIKEFAGKKLILDFEGSDVPGIKSFYKNFGAEDQRYYSVKYNNLPWPLSRFKK